MPLFAAGAAAAVVAAAVGVALCVAVAVALCVAVAVAVALALAAGVAFFVATGFDVFVAAAVATGFAEVEVDDEADAEELVPVEPIAAPPAIFNPPLDDS